MLFSQIDTRPTGTLLVLSLKRGQRSKLTAYMIVIMASICAGDVDGFIVMILTRGSISYRGA